MFNGWSRKEVAERFEITKYVQAVTERFDITKIRSFLRRIANADEMQQVPYREVVGTLRWAATMTRPDLSFTNHQLTTSNDNPGPVHWKAARKALRTRESLSEKP